MKIVDDNYNKDNYLNIIIQFIKFGIVGASNTLISIGVYDLLIFMGVNFIVSNTIGFILGTINAYYWNNKYVFKKSKDEKRSIAKSGIKVFISYGLTFLLGTGLLILFVKVFNISKYLAPILILFITIPLNFLLNKLWAFKLEKQGADN